KNENGQSLILKIIQNINAQKVSENSIISLNDFNDRILKSIEDAVIVLNSDLKIVKANEAFSKLFNIPLQNTGVSFTDLIDPYDENKELQHKIMLVISTQKSFSNAALKLNPDTPDEKIFEVNCSAMQQEPGEPNLLLVIHDITAHKQAEREREDMIGFIGHELKNPLTSLLLCQNLMELQIEDENLADMKTLLERNKTNILRLNKMISELYNSTKINAGYFELEQAEFVFGDMIKEAVDSIMNLNSECDIVVENYIGNITVSGDRSRIIQVVMNYLSNAIKYSDSKKNIRIILEQENNYINVAVKDEGPGIAKGQIPFIFNRFFRVEKTRNLEGIGLGLFLCKQIIHAHHGNVWVESEEGVGSTFHFSIPRS
ncbi:MAG: ATP-binding protein, partial [Ferruginibacter sp.]